MFEGACHASPSVAALHGLGLVQCHIPPCPPLTLDSRKVTTAVAEARWAESRGVLPFLLFTSNRALPCSTSTFTWRRNTGQKSDGRAGKCEGV